MVVNQKLSRFIYLIYKSTDNVLFILSKSLNKDLLNFKIFVTSLKTKLAWLN